MQYSKTIVKEIANVVQVVVGESDINWYRVSQFWSKVKSRLFLPHLSTAHNSGWLFFVKHQGPLNLLFGFRQWLWWPSRKGKTEITEDLQNQYSTPGGKTSSSTKLINIAGKRSVSLSIGWPRNHVTIPGELIDQSATTTAVCTWAHLKIFADKILIHNAHVQTIRYSNWNRKNSDNLCLCTLTGFEDLLKTIPKQVQFILRLYARRYSGAWWRWSAKCSIDGMDFQSFLEFVERCLNCEFRLKREKCTSIVKTGEILQENDNKNK